MPWEDDRENNISEQTFLKGHKSSLLLKTFFKHSSHYKHMTLALIVYCIFQMTQHFYTLDMKRKYRF